MSPIRLALFISGGGTTAHTIIHACKTGKLHIDPVLVIASHKRIRGIDRALQAGIPKDSIHIIDPIDYKTRDEFGTALKNKCEEYSVDLIGQYGWLPLTPKLFIDAYPQKIINQHPGPLDPPGPDFGGKGMWGRRVHCAVLYFRRKTGHDMWTEASTHFVTEHFDEGEVIKRIQVEIRPSDTVEDVQARVLLMEHQAQIEVLRDFSEGRVDVTKRVDRLIPEEEYGILEEAKEIAGLLYPNG